MEEKTKDLIRILLSLIIPPVGVFLQVGLGLHFWINIAGSNGFCGPGEYD